MRFILRTLGVRDRVLVYFWVKYGDERVSQVDTDVTSREEPALVFHIVNMSGNHFRVGV